MIKFKKYTDSGSLGTHYVFGINLYDIKTRPTLDIIIGKKVYVCFYNKKIK